MAKPKRPIFVDESIQWHLSTSSHDKCPVCGGHVGYLGARQRDCMEICGFSYTLPMSSREWFKQKLDGLEPLLPTVDVSKVLPAISNVEPMSLKQAQHDSLDKTARIPIRVAAGMIEYVYWPASDYEPHDSPEKKNWSRKKRETVKAGSQLWRALLAARTWQPVNPKGVLDKLIDDGPAQLLRRKPVVARR